jgi:tetratricopeptide (TPR) repeat protein
MPRIPALLLTLLLAATPAQGSSPKWVEVRSAHFTVVTDAGAGEGRRTLDQFEHMRLVFQTLFPRANVDPVAPIVVMAVRNKKEFQPLEPAVYMARGQLNLAGYFLLAPDKNYVLLRLDAEDEQHPYATIYHEYTHLQIGNATAWMPLWLNEGLAEFFQNTDFVGNEARLGQPSQDNLLYLQQNRLIPLETLFRVDAKSPYYHEEQKGSVFYAESWALVHYLETSDVRNHTNHVSQYLDRVSQHQDPVMAAQIAFGDLKQLQKTLQNYTDRQSYTYFTMKLPPLNEGAFTVTPLAGPEADAIRADFMAYIGRTADARALLAQVMAADPKNAQACETMGYLSYRDGNRADAKKWYAKAVALNSQSYIAQYYFGALSLMDDETGPQVEASLRAAIRLNQRFAPAYDALAAMYGRRRENLDEAHMLSLQAVLLEPGNVQYRIDCANLLMELHRFDDAVRVLEAAKAVAKTPQQLEIVEARLGQVQLYQGEMEQAEKQRTAAQTMQEAQGSSAAMTAYQTPVFQHPTEKPHGPTLTAQGVIHGVRCSYPAVLELQVAGTKGTVKLYNNNYYNIEYSAANFTPQGEIHPCSDLEGTKAKVQYFATADKTVDGQIIGILLSK